MHPIQIAVIGSGRVAQTLLRLSYDAQISIGGIYARNQQKAEALALKYNTKAVNSISALKADLILLCVSDDALPEVIGQLSPQQFAAYTAGSPSIKLFGYGIELKLVGKYLSSIAPSRKEPSKSTRGPLSVNQGSRTTNNLPSFSVQQSLTGRPWTNFCSPRSVAHLSSKKSQSLVVLGSRTYDI
jgi:hypothetical protein